MPEESGEFFIEMSGQSSSSSSTAEPASKDALPASSASETAKPLELRATYSNFSQRVPSRVDQGGMRAKCEDGLLVATMQRAKTENVKRQQIAIN